VSARPQLNNRIVRTNRNPEAERKDREKKNPDNSKKSNGEFDPGSG
jgi:hypothetical protein